MGKNSAEITPLSKSELILERQILKRKINKLDDNIVSAVVTSQSTSASSDSELTRLKTELYLQEVHDAFKQLNCKNPDTQNRQREYLLEKLCEKCFDPDHDDLLLLCDVCDDAYHTFCLVLPALIHIKLTYSCYRIHL